MKKEWKAKCIDVGYGNHWSLGDIIVVENYMIKAVTDRNGNINIQKTEKLKGCQILGVKDINFRISGEWEFITDEPQPSVSDPINPDHYNSQCSLECIDAMIMAFGPDHVYKWCVITAWKYMWRYRNKNGVQDIEKARWYIDKAMELGFDEQEVYNLEYVLEKIEKEVGVENGKS